MTSKKNKQDQSLENIIITNEKIVNFYNKNKQLDIEKINLLYIELFENILSASFNNPSIVNQIMLSLNNQNNELNNIMLLLKSSSEIYKNELANIKEVNLLSINNIKTEMEQIKTSISSLNNLLMTKLYETKDIYMKEVKELLKNSENNSILSLGTTIEKYNSQLIDKIIMNISEVVPKSQAKQYDELINLFKKDMLSSLNEIKENDPKVIIDKISNVVDTKYNSLLSSLHENMITNISQSEIRLTNNLNQLKEVSTKSSVIQESINDELIKYISKSKTISGKGNQSENILFNILSDEYTTAEIINTSKEYGKGDIIIKRKDKTPLLIETKNYTTNVKKDEIDKFIRDVTLNECNGIFLSQTSGIVGKENYQIDFHNKNILIYVHNVNYDITKINLAINTIDILYDKLVKINEKNVNIPTETLKDINSEYQSFIIQKDKMVSGLKEYYKKTFEQYSELTLPSLEKFISGYYANTKKNLITCQLCKTYETDNLRSMARHKQACKKKDKKVDDDITSDNKSSEEKIEEYNNDEVIEDIKKIDDDTMDNILEEIEEYKISSSDEKSKKAPKKYKTKNKKQKDIDV